MRRKTIAIDVDGTIRDFHSQAQMWLEYDHPNKFQKFLDSKSYYSLDEAFGNREEVHKWIYEQRVFEIFVQAQRLHKNIIDDLNIFSVAAEGAGWDVLIATVQRDRSITATLQWLAKYGCRIKTIKFFNSMQDKIDADYDVYLDDCPEVLEKAESSAIKVPYVFNEHIKCPSLDIINGEFDNIYELLGIERTLKKG